MQTDNPGDPGSPPPPPPPPGPGGGKAASGGSGGGAENDAGKKKKEEKPARRRPAGAMSDFELLMPAAYPVSRDSVIMLFLGLFLLVLTFFILLVSISTVHVEKSNAVMSSLNSAFQITAVNDPEQAQMENEVTQSVQLQDAVADIFATSLGIAKIEILQRGRLMRVQMQARAVFEDDSTEVRESMGQLFDRVIAAAKDRPQNLHFEIEAVMSLPAGERGAMPVAETLGMRRAGAFARALIDRGLPPGILAAGLYPAEEGLMDLWFYIRPAVELREDLAPEAETEAEAAPEPETRPAPAAPQTTGQGGAVSIQLPGG